MSCRNNLIKRISSISASLCPEVFRDYTVRGDIDKIEWNMDMLIDEGNSLNTLRDLAVILENTVELRGIK